jgi:hypothetical protein
MPLEATFAADSNRGYGFGIGSQAGLVLTQRTLPVTFNLTGVVRGGTSSNWLVGSNGSTSIATSSDGITWTTATASQALYPYAAGAPGSTYVTVDGTNARYSSTGATWTTTATYWSGAVGFIKWFPNISVYFYKRTGSAAESASSAGSTWSNRAGTGYTAYDGATNGTTTGWPTYGSQYFEYTTSGSWTSITSPGASLPSTKNWIGAAYDSTNNKFVVYDDSGVAAYSTSGTSGWTQITIPTLSGYTYSTSNAAGNGVYVLAGTGGYLYSTTGTTFEKISLGSGDHYAAYDSTNTRFLIMKGNSTTYYTGVKP